MFERFFPKYITMKNIFFFIMAILFLVFISKVQDIAIMFFASYVIACSINPIVDKLEKKFKRSTATLITLSSILIGIISIITPLLFLVGNEIKKFSTSFPAIYKHLYYTIISSPIIKKFGGLNLNWNEIISSLSNYTSNIVNELVNLGINLSSTLIYIIVSIIIIYYFVADKELIRKAYLKLFPSQLREKAGEIIEIISQKIGGYVIALLTTMLCVGLVMIIGLSVLKNNYAIFLGLLTALFDIIPIVGPAIALIICIIVSLESGPGAIIGVLIVFAIAQILENNIVRPYVFGKILDIHPIMIYLFLFITAKYIGATGVIFAPAIAATVCVLIEELYIKNIN